MLNKQASVDAEFPILNGISLLKRFLLLNPVAHVAAICRNENGGCIQLLKNIGVDGYFYLDAKGARLENQRGLTFLLLSSLEVNPAQAEVRAIQNPFHLLDHKKATVLNSGELTNDDQDNRRGKNLACFIQESGCG